MTLVKYLSSSCSFLVSFVKFVVHAIFFEALRIYGWCGHANRLLSLGKEHVVIALTKGSMLGAEVVMFRCGMLTCSSWVPRC